MIRRSVFGPFSAHHLGDGSWRLTTRSPDPVQIHLKLEDSMSAAPLQDPAVQRLDVEWRDSDVVVTVTGATGAAVLKAKTVILHEPRASLYERLPLAPFDAKARRFWTRLFCLMRIPGGRLLLALLARRNP